MQGLVQCEAHRGVFSKFFSGERMNACVQPDVRNEQVGLIDRDCFGSRS